MTDDMTVDLEAATVLLAGASGGLGGALARELHDRGARLTLVGRDRERLDALDVPGERHVADLRDPDACKAAVAAAGERLDVLVDATGAVAFGPVDELDVDTLEELFLTNVFLPVWLTQAALPVLGERSVVVHLAGVVAEQATAGMVAYSASKAALRAFDDGLGRELRRRRIRVLDARPPHTETGLAGRPLAGTAPKLPTGLDPADVARTICDAIAAGTTDLPSEAFAGG